MGGRPLPASGQALVAPDGSVTRALAESLTPPDGGPSLGLPGQAFRIASVSTASRVPPLFPAVHFLRPRHVGRLPAVRPFQPITAVSAILPRTPPLCFWGAVEAHDWQRLFNVAWDQTGSRLLSGGDDGAVRVWDATHATVQSTARGISPHPVQVLAVSPCNRWFAAASDLDADAAAREQRRRASRSEQQVGTPRTVRVWRCGTVEPLCTLVLHRASIVDMAFDPALGVLVTAGSDGELCITDLDQVVSDSERSSAHEIDLSDSDEDVAASSSHRRLARRSSKLSGDAAGRGGREGSRPLVNLRGETIVPHAHGDNFAAWIERGQAHIAAAALAEQETAALVRLTERQRAIQQAQAQAASTGRDPAAAVARVIDAAESAQLEVEETFMPPLPDQVSCLRVRFWGDNGMRLAEGLGSAAVHPRGGVVAVGCDDGSIRIVRTVLPNQAMKPDEASFTSLLCSFDGTQLASFHEHGGRVNHIEFSPSGEQCVDSCDSSCLSYDLADVRTSWQACDDRG